jgi:hypothetical protein
MKLKNNNNLLTLVYTLLLVSFFTQPIKTDPEYTFSKPLVALGSGACLGYYIYTVSEAIKHRDCLLDKTLCPSCKDQKNKSKLRKKTINELDSVLKSYSYNAYLKEQFLRVFYAQPSTYNKVKRDKKTLEYKELKKRLEGLSITPAYYTLKYCDKLNTARKQASNRLITTFHTINNKLPEGDKALLASFIAGVSGYKIWRLTQNDNIS